MSKHTKYLIIGNSAAAIGGVEGIRSVDPLGQILLISDEPYHTYSRPLISYWLEGKVNQDKMIYRSPSFYDDYGVQTKLGVKVLSLNPERKEVTLDTDEVISFDQCLIATGSVPFVPPINGKDTALDAITFTKMDDAKKAFEVIERCRIEGRKPKVVILGAGLIGIKAAEALYKNSEEITILDLANRVMPSVFNENASYVMENHIKNKGINLLLETSIEEIGDHIVKLTNGDLLNYDLLILAVGTRPNIELTAGTNIQTDRGIITNSRQETNAKNIYAAGDCTISHDISSDTVKNIAILPNAFLQGETAGKNMAGLMTEGYDLFPLNSMGFLGLYLLTAGTYSGDSVIVETPECYKEFFIDNNHLSGYIIIGTCDRGGIYTDLIRNHTDLSSVNLEALLNAPALSAFSKEERARKLSLPH